MPKITFLILFFITHSIWGQKPTFYDFCQINGPQIAPTYEQVNCVQFLDQALKKYLQINDPVLTKYIYINYSKEVIHSAIPENNIAILGGVSYGLVRGGYATWVELKDIKRGDIVQYWSVEGFINGHCGVFDSYDKFGNMILLGSHIDSKGYGKMSVYNTNLKCLFFVCRLKN